MPRILTSLTVAAAMIPASLHAQSNCANRDTVVNKLESGYGEVFAGGGMQNSSSVFEVWFSEEKGTWTILLTRADGTTCIMASGTNWREALPSQQKAKGTAS